MSGMAITEAAYRNHEALFPSCKSTLKVTHSKLDELFDNFAFGEMYQRSPEDQLHIQRFLSANCFGDYYTLAGLEPRIRELVTPSFLIALGGCDSQVKGHIRGNVNVGNDRDVLLDVITQLLPCWSAAPSAPIHQLEGRRIPIGNIESDLSPCPTDCRCRYVK
jgi:alkylhydroperoxidase/carboxymuconolactone decarboxylase family protein YurZ